MYQAWGRRLRDRRLARGLSQRRLARLIGVTPGTISKYESGALCPPDAMKLRLGRTLMFSLDEIFPWPMGVPA